MSAVHILHTPMKEVMRRQDGDERWCFVCRQRRLFERIVTAPVVEPLKPGEEDTYELPIGAYYGPTTRIECRTCKTTDGDCFPGTYRVWEDEQ